MIICWCYYNTIIAMQKNLFYYLGLVTQLGLTIIACILVSLLLGRWIDQKLGLRGTFTVIFILMGIAAGFLSVYKQIMGKNGN